MLPLVVHGCRGNQWCKLQQALVSATKSMYSAALCQESLWLPTLRLLLVGHPDTVALQGGAVLAGGMRRIPSPALSGAVRLRCGGLPAEPNATPQSWRIAGP